MVLNSFSEAFHDMVRGFCQALRPGNERSSNLIEVGVDLCKVSCEQQKKTVTTLGASWKRDRVCSPRPNFPDLESALRRGC
jgi:hypothetical protein